MVPVKNKKNTAETTVQPKTKKKATPRKSTPSSTKTPKSDIDLKDAENQKYEDHNRELGRRGEAAAVRFLEQRGFYIHDRNWRCRAGEVDIVAEEDEALVFVEVKTRSNYDKGLPEEAVDSAKRKRYEKLAAYYLRDHEFIDKSIRFDVISILAVAPDRAFLRHHRGAFALDE